MKKKFTFFLYFLVIFFSEGKISESCARDLTRPLHIHLKFLPKKRHPFIRQVLCYTQCPQSIGRQGALALETLWAQNYEQRGPYFFRFLAERHQSEDHRALMALRCAEGCRLKTVPKFLSRFLGTLHTPELVRQVGWFLGQKQGGKKTDKSKAPKKTLQGSETLLGQIVFSKALRRKARHTLRHMDAETQQFHSNLEILKKVYYELYGVHGEKEGHV